MNQLMKFILMFAAGFHLFSATIYFFLKESDKCMNRADMAIVFLALYAILKNHDKK